MDKHTTLSLLEELAQRLGITIRYETVKKEDFIHTGGLCILRGEHILIINSRASTVEKIRVLASALKRFDLGHVYVRPAVRELLDSLDS
jgi:N-dimethylarginine dimethylaminohydrolase